MGKKLHVECLGYEVFNGELDQAFTVNKTLVNTINQYSFCIAEKDREFSDALRQSDVLLPDGIAIVAAAKFLKGKKITKIAGADLHNHLIRKLEVEKGSCFYLGASEETLEKIKIRLAEEYPNIDMGFYSPPFKPAFSKEDNDKMLSAVNNFAPDVLFIGMTAPKQEKWAFANKEMLNAQVICSIGAVFDFYAGTVKRPGKVWINLGLEWLGRLLKEPKRMWKRYIYYGFIFTYSLIREKLRTTSRK